jgi:hypothetical protein
MLISTSQPRSAGAKSAIKNYPRAGPENFVLDLPIDILIINCDNIFRIATMAIKVFAVRQNMKAQFFILHNE